MFNCCAKGEEAMVIREKTGKSGGKTYGVPGR
jgi:hypothetical protein